jgi:hypothetical protein
MKTAFAFTFMMLGALLVLTPTISEHLYRQSVQALISHPAVNLTTMYSHFSARMGHHYELGYWSAGMAVIGVAFLIWRHRTAQQNGST